MTSPGPLRDHQQAPDTTFVKRYFRHLLDGSGAQLSGQVRGRESLVNLAESFSLASTGTGTCTLAQWDELGISIGPLLVIGIWLLV